MDKISRMPISIDEEDITRWSLTRDGIFTVKSAYNKLVEDRFNFHTAINTVPKTVWKSLWKMKLPHRVKLFTWKCLKNIFQTNDKTTRFNPDISSICSICNQQEETLFHLFLQCNHSSAVWRLLNINIDLVAASCNSIKEWVISWFENNALNGVVDQQKWRVTLMVGCWIIWK